MKRTAQEIVELVAFGLIAVIVGTGVLWLAGALLGLAGSLLQWLAWLLWLVLRYIIPVAVIVAAVYALIKLAQRQSQPATAMAGGAVEEAPPVDAAPEASPPAPEASAANEGETSAPSEGEQSGG